MTSAERMRRRPMTPIAEIEAGKRALAAVPGADFARSLLAQGLDYRQAMAKFARIVIEVALADNSYDKTAAGRQLHLTRDNVRRIARSSELQ